VTFSVTGD